MTRSVLAVLCALIAWLTIGPQISSFLDRFFTIPYANLPLGGPYALDASQFIVGSRRWILPKDLNLALDAQRRVTLSRAGRAFTFGPLKNCASDSAGACYEFAPDPDDQISFLKCRSWLSWPTPFQFSILGAPRASWHRHSYNRLLWKKRSGATIAFVWPDEQAYYPGHGWADGNLEIAPLIEITP